MAAKKYELQRTVQRLSQSFKIADTERFVLLEDVASRFHIRPFSWTPALDGLDVAGKDTKRWYDAGIVDCLIGLLQDAHQYPDVHDFDSPETALKARSIVTMLSVVRAFCEWIFYSNAALKKTTSDEDFLHRFQAIFRNLWNYCCLPFAASQRCMPRNWVGSAPAKLVITIDLLYDHLWDSHIMFKDGTHGMDILLYTFLYPPPILFPLAR